MGWKTVLLCIIGIILAGLIVGGLWIWSYLAPPPAIILQSVSGTVEVLHDDSWTPAVQDQKLQQTDHVRTKQGTATVLFYGTSILRLDANTEITLTQVDSESIVNITQSSGKTWNRVVKKSGLPIEPGMQGLKGYAIVLPSAVATVRGTSFAASANDPNTVSAVQNTVIMSSGSSEQALNGQTGTVSGGTIQVVPLVNDPWIQQNAALDAEFDKQFLASMRVRYQYLIEYAKKKFSLTDEQIDKTILDYLHTGEISPDIKENV